MLRRAEPDRVIDRIQNFFLGLLVFTGAFVVIDGPYNAAFILGAIVFALAGFRVTLPLMPFFIVTLLYFFGGVISLLPYIDQFIPSRYIVTIFFLACTSFYFALQMQERTGDRLAVIRNASIASAVISCFIGLIGYFDVAGLAQYFRVYEGRASGTFRDPNVFGSFLILPAMFLMQDLIVGQKRGLWWRAIAFLLVVIMIFLSFSRGSWIAFGGSAMILIALTLATDFKQRGRILVMAVAALVFLVIMVAVVLSIDDVREVFEQRAKLTQSYDEGRTGRFGKMLLAIPKLLDHPNGLGPLRFSLYFFEDPHNTYVNGFTNFGWFGGLSYLTLIVLTLYIGFRHVFERSPWQRDAIAVWAALLMHFVQGFQIDTNTWRHFNMMMGLIWGMAAAWTVIKWRREKRLAAGRSAKASVTRAAQPATAAR
ncbi:MAG: O-antigen ligase family protein [Beijerinckiaceae bacterium]